MKIPNYKWYLLVALINSALLGFAYPTAALAEPSPLVQNIDSQKLYLEVTLNQLSLRRIEPFVLQNGRLYGTNTTLKNLGLTWPGATAQTDLIALDNLPGLQYQYDVANQLLNLNVPVELLRGTKNSFGYKDPPAPQLDQSAQAAGLLLNYDIYGQKYRESSSLNGWTELRMFGVGPGVWRNTSVLQSSDSKWLGRQFNTTRLDSSWQLDFPDSMISLTLGDSFSSPLSWSRSMRFGGLRISRNFNLQPYRMTVPLAFFAGETALPSVVDLYVNGVRESRNEVGPGPFEIVGTPIVNGAGNAQMVITDITGQRRVVNVPFYNSARLLRQGLTDWSFEFGALRRSYGIESFSYQRTPLTSGSLRYGLNNAITLETHAEHADKLSMGGAGALIRLGEAGGVLRASAAASKYQKQSGQQYGMGYEWQGQNFNFSISKLRYSKDFRDVGTLDGSQLPRESSQAFIGFNTKFGQFGASLVEQSHYDGYSYKFVGLNWSRSLGKFGYINIGANRDLKGNSGTQVYLYWNIPLGDRRQAWTSVNHNQYGTNTTIGAAQNLPSENNGWGWRMQANRNEFGANNGLGEIRHQSKYGELFVGGQYWQSNEYDNNNMLYAGANGGLLWMQGGLFPMRKADNAFALVSTDGIESVPVKYENRPIGATDKNGKLLISSLNAWENNNISIDPLGLPADVKVDYVQINAVPATASGVLARFPMQEMLMVVLGVKDQSGEFLPPGTIAQTQSNQKITIIGYDGRMYLESPTSGETILIQTENGICNIRLPDNLPKRGYIDIGELICH